MANKSRRRLRRGRESNEPLRALFHEAALFCRPDSYDRIRRERALSAVEGSRVVCYRSNAGLRLVIHPCVRTDGKPWQISTIGYDGIPCGHECAPTFEEAVFRAKGCGEQPYYNYHGYRLEWCDTMPTPAPV